MLGTWRLGNVAIHGWTKRALAYVAGALLCMLVLLLADQWSKQWKPIPQGPKQPSGWASFWQDGDCFFETGIWPWKTTASIASEVCVEQPHYRTPAWYAHVLNPHRQHPSPPLVTAMEIGIDKGQTTETLARAFKEVHVFDFQERAEKIQRQIAAKGPDFGSVVTHGNSHQIRDSYTYSLKTLLQMEPGSRPVFDYVYLDGAHEWHHDGFAHLLIDLMLRPGGIIEFDDYWWSIEKSPTVNPTVTPEITTYFTKEQIHEPQVKECVDLLVTEDPNYEQVDHEASLWHRIFRKKTTAPSVPAQVERNRMAKHMQQHVPVHARDQEYYKSILPEGAHIVAAIIGGNANCAAVAQHLLEPSLSEALYILDAECEGIAGSNCPMDPYKAKQIAHVGVRVISIEHSHKLKDSYTYSLKKMLRTAPRPQLHYAYIDGDLEWHRDGFAFMLLDKMLQGKQDLFTTDQLNAAQIGEVLDILVRASGRYEEVVKDRAFKKLK